MQHNPRADQEIFAHEEVRALLGRIQNSLRVSNDLQITHFDAAQLRQHGIDELARAAALSPDSEVRDAARWLISEAGHRLGVEPASIQDLYLARGRGEVRGFTVPAINIRVATYDTARALFAAARKRDAGAFICEIARSEIGYTAQRPAEYVNVLIAAAIKEGWTGPLFIQGDHFQVNAKKYAVDPVTELAAVRDLIAEAIHAGFYNIDVDTSTLVDPTRESLIEQQAVNCRLSAEFTALIRRVEPKGVTVSVGGEIGEVGTENSTPEELRAFMDGYAQEMERQANVASKTMTGLSKISVQTGTTHGGTVLPDGTIADANVDFEALKLLSEIARQEYAMAGAVQHGASTLKPENFRHFPAMETAEIHLATGFQNLFLDHPVFPKDLRDQMDVHCAQYLESERKEGDSEAQFLYRARKKAVGTFKTELWGISETIKSEIRATLEKEFGFYLDTLKVSGTREIVARYVPLPGIRKPGPSALRFDEAADDWDLSD